MEHVPVTAVTNSIAEITANATAKGPTRKPLDQAQKLSSAGDNRIMRSHMATFLVRNIRLNMVAPA
jgi:hypothetical protein